MAFIFFTDKTSLFIEKLDIFYMEGCMKKSYYYYKKRTEYEGHIIDHLQKYVCWRKVSKRSDKQYWRLVGLIFGKFTHIVPDDFEYKVTKRIRNWYIRTLIKQGKVLIALKGLKQALYFFLRNKQAF